MHWFKLWLGSLMRSTMFMVDDGNDDKADLVNPGKYGKYERVPALLSYRKW